MCCRLPLRYPFEVLKICIYQLKKAYALLYLYNILCNIPGITLIGPTSGLGSFSDQASIEML